MYFISKNDRKDGPLTFTEVTKLKLTDDILIWKEGMPNWVKISELPEFKNYIIKLPPPLPSEQYKNETTKYTNRIFITNAIIGFFLGLILDFLMVNYSLTGGGEYPKYHIFITQEERNNPSILFWEYLPYCLIIGEIIFLIISLIQFLLYRPDKKTNSTTENLFWGVIMIIFLGVFVMILKNIF